MLMVIFMATMLLIFATMAAPNIKTEGQREKEKEMIWRGRQYARAVKLYYRKMGRFPTSMDDLTKPKVGSLRFLRQPYKDPMNAQDGSWRLIYVGPAGQLIGSLKPQDGYARSFHGSAWSSQQRFWLCFRAGHRTSRGPQCARTGGYQLLELRDKFCQCPGYHGKSRFRGSGNRYPGGRRCGNSDRRSSNDHGGKHHWGREQGQ